MDVRQLFAAREIKVVDPQLYEGKLVHPIRDRQLVKAILEEAFQRHLPPPKGFFRSRARILAPLAMALSFSIGAYVLVKTTYGDKIIPEEEKRTSSTSTA